MKRLFQFLTTFRRHTGYFKIVPCLCVFCVTKSSVRFQHIWAPLCTYSAKASPIPFILCCMNQDQYYRMSFGIAVSLVTFKHGVFHGQYTVSALFGTFLAHQSQGISVSSCNTLTLALPHSLRKRIKFDH